MIEKNDDIIIIDKVKIKKLKKEHKELIKKEKLDKEIKILKGLFIITFD
jgi:hypothetical protein